MVLNAIFNRFDTFVTSTRNLESFLSDTSKYMNPYQSPKNMIFYYLFVYYPVEKRILSETVQTFLFSKLEYRNNKNIIESFYRWWRLFYTIKVYASIHH